LPQLKESEGWKICPPVTNDLIAQGAEALKSLIEQIEAPRVVLVIDQFEEIFSRPQNDTQQFLECLLGALALPKFCLVIVMRADFMGKCAEYDAFAQLIQENMLMVTSMNQDELEQAIIEPAKQVGLGVEQELVTQMLKDMEGCPLPLLQYTLEQLWQRRTENWLTLAEYVRMGGVKCTLKNRADGVYQSLSTKEQATAQWIFQALTRFGEGVEDTRQPVLKSALITPKYSEKLVDKTLHKLVEARLVVMSSGDVPVVEMAHEVLIYQWPRLRKWINDDRDFPLWRQRLGIQVKKWLENHKDSLLLLQGSSLKKAKQYYQEKKSELNRKEQQFIRASFRDKFLSRVGAVGFSVILITYFVFRGIFWLADLIEDEIYADHPGLRETIELLPHLASNLRRLREIEAVGYEKVAMELVSKTMEGLFPIRVDNAVERRNAIPSHFYSSVIHFPILETYLLFDKLGLSQDYLIDIGDNFRTVTFGPNNKFMGLVNPAHVVRILDIETKQEITRIAHDSDVAQVRFDFAGQWLATVTTKPCLLQVWNLVSGDQIFTHDCSKINSLAFSQNSQLIAIGDEEKIARVWDVSSKRLLANIVHNNAVKWVEFNPTGKWLSTKTKNADGEVTARIWEIDTGKEITDILPKLKLKAIAFSPNGEWFVASVNDHMARVISVYSGKERSIIIHKSDIIFAKFDPNSEVLLTGDRDGNLKLSDIESGRELSLAHDKPIISAVFHSDKWLMTLNEDFSISFFDRDGGQELSRISFDEELISFLGKKIKAGQEITRIYPEKAVHDLAFSPNGKWVVTASANGLAQIWDIETGRRLLGVKHEEAIITTSFSQDNRWLATGSRDGTARIWEVNTGEEIRKVSHDGPVNFVTFSDKWLATASMDKTVRIWETATAKEIYRLVHEEPVWLIEFSENGEKFATVSRHERNRIRIWESETGEEITYIYDLFKLEQMFQSSGG